MEKDWEKEEKGVAEDETVRKHQWPNGYESEQTLGDSEGQGGLTCCSSWGRKEWWLNNWTTATRLIQHSEWSTFHDTKFLFFPIYLSIYLAEQVWVAVCGMFTCGMQDFFFSLLAVVCRIQYPDQGLNLGLLYWQHGVLPTDHQGNPKISTWRKNICNYQMSWLDLYFKPEI